MKKPPFSSSSLVAPLALFLLCCIGVQAGLRQLNPAVANVLCPALKMNGSDLVIYQCNFFDPRIWDNEVYPGDNDDVLMYTSDISLSIYINFTSLNLGDINMQGTVALTITNSTSFSAKIVHLEEGSQIQVTDSTVSMKTLGINDGVFLSSASDINIDDLWTENMTTVSLSNATLMACGTCSFDEILLTSDSMLIADVVTFASDLSTLNGKAIINSLVVNQQAQFVSAVINNLTILTNAHVISSSYLQISQLYQAELSYLITTQSAFIAVDPTSSITGQGSMVFEQNVNFTFGNPAIVVDLTPFTVHFLGANSGTFTNVAFGELISFSHSTVVSLTMIRVSFTVPASLFANITATGITILKPLSLLGQMNCTDGETLIYDQLMCNVFYQNGGFLEMSGYIVTNSFLSFVSTSFNALGPSYIKGDVMVTNSSISLLYEVQVQGDWISDTSCKTNFLALSASYSPRLNVSGDVVLNGVLEYSLAAVPTTPTSYVLIAYSGVLTGSYTTSFAGPSSLNQTYLKLEASGGTLTLSYTPPSAPQHHNNPSFWAPGPKLYATIAGMVIFLLLLVLSIIVIRRKQQRQYEVIPD